MTPEEKAQKAAKVAEDLRRYALKIGTSSPFGKKIGAQVYAAANQVIKIAETDPGILDYINASNDAAANSEAQKDEDLVDPYKGEHSLSKAESTASSSYPSPQNTNESQMKYRTSSKRRQATKLASSRRRLASQALALGDKDLANKLILAAKKIERRYGLNKSAAGNAENPGTPDDRDHIAQMIDMEMGEEYANVENFKGNQAEDGGQGSGPWGGGDPEAILNIKSGSRKPRSRKPRSRKPQPSRQPKKASQALIDQAFAKAFPNQ